MVNSLIFKGCISSEDELETRKGKDGDFVYLNASGGDPNLYVYNHLEGWQAVGSTTATINADVLDRSRTHCEACGAPSDFRFDSCMYCGTPYPIIQYK